ncbi:hypothetical protein GCM10009837_59090 [Streptomyces durmitorensis]
MRGHTTLVPAAQQDLPGVEFLKPGDRTQQRGLAAAARPEHAHDLVLVDREPDTIEHGPRREPHGRIDQGQQPRTRTTSTTGPHTPGTHTPGTHTHTHTHTHQNSPVVRSVRSRSSSSSDTAHTTIKIVESAIACP